MANVRLLPDIDVSKRKYLLDTNFLFCVFASVNTSINNENRQKKYLNFFKKAKEQKLELLVTSFALSEYFNRVLHDYYNKIWKIKPENRGKEYKAHFRISVDCRNCIQAIKEEMNDITSFCRLVDDSFSVYKKENYFPYFDAFDFNDSLFAHVSIQNDCVLVTEDRDYNAPVFKDLNILTANDTMYRTREN